MIDNLLERLVALGAYFADLQSLAELVTPGHQAGWTAAPGAVSPGLEATTREV